MANNTICKSVGSDTIQIRTHDNVVRTLTNVRHILKLGKNLISLVVLNDKGYKYSGEGGAIWVTKGTLVVMKGIKKGSLYILQDSTVTDSTATISLIEQLESD